MIDSFVLLTPILMLPVVVLLAFVGCDWVFGLDRVEPKIPILTGVAGNARVDLSWREDPNSGKFRVKRGTESGSHTLIAEVDYGTYEFSDTNVLNDTTYYYVVTAFGGEDGETDPSNEVAVRPQAEVVTTFVTSATLGGTAAATGLFGMAVTIGPNPVTVKALGRGFVSGNTQIHVVKIVDATTKADVPNAAVAVFTSGGLAGQVNYAALATPVTLNANTAYYIVSQEMASGDRFYNHDTAIMTTSVATVTSSVNGNGTTYNEDSGPGMSYALVDFQY